MGASPNPESPHNFDSNAERDERADIAGVVNIADRTATEAGASWSEIKDWPEKYDGSVVHSPVGSYPANAFGLHEVHGNLWEWCLDHVGSSYTTQPSKDPVGPTNGNPARTVRGGGFTDIARRTRASNRGFTPRDSAGSLRGVRPARRVTD